jgi:hypothetical protein
MRGNQDLHADLLPIVLQSRTLLGPEDASGSHWQPEHFSGIRKVVEELFG